MRLLSARHQCLTKLAADGLTTVEPQVTGAGGQPEQLGGPWRSKPLECERQLPAVEVFALRIGSERVDRSPWRRRGIQHRNAFTVDRAQPAVGRPNHRLNRGFATERAAASISQWSTTEVDHVGLTRGRL